MGAKEKIRRHAELVAMDEYFDLLISGHLHVEDDYIWVKEYELGGVGRDHRLDLSKTPKKDFRRREIRSINLGTWLVQPRVLWLIGDRIEFETLG